MAVVFVQAMISAIRLCSSTSIPFKIHKPGPCNYMHCRKFFIPPRLSSSQRNRAVSPPWRAQMISTLAETVEREISLRVPLFSRQPIFSTCVQDLLKWKKWAKELVSSVGSKYLIADGGPNIEDLSRELEWFLEDVVEGYSPYSIIGSSNNETTLHMRASMEDLYSLWSERIEKRRPFQYVVGCAHWRDLVLAVQEGVLIPRPETEQLIDIVQNAVLTDGSLAEGLWADMGTGSGALAIGLGHLLDPEGRVVAIDLSHVAASVARYNVQRYGLQGRVEVREGSWFLPLQDVKGKLAGVLSNPPYIPTNQISGLQVEVGKYEPRLALDGGHEGIDDLLILCRGSISVLRPGGFIGLETNGGRQAQVIADFLCSSVDNSFRDVRILCDYAGIPRFVTAFHC